MRFLIPSFLAFQFVFVYMGNRYTGQMLRVMQRIAHSSSSLSFPSWGKKAQGMNPHTQALWICTYAREDAVLMVLCVCVCMFACPTDSAVQSSPRCLCVLGRTF